jgi:endonuclease/exonuclease/phosphatase (EEP) superfamily protein YafD
VRRNVYRFALLLIAVIVVGIGAPLAWISVDRAGRPPLQLGPTSDSRRTLSVVSLNMAKEADVGRIFKELGDHKSILDADVLLLQEVAKPSERAPSVADEIAGRLNRHVLFASPEKLPTTLGVAIVSKYPLRDAHIRNLRRANLVFRTRSRVALAATVDTPVGPVRIAEAHLDTRINPEARADQIDPVVRDAEAFNGPAVIGGDFNTNDLLWFAAVVPIPAPGRQAAAVRRLMESHGFFTPFGPTGATFDHLGMELDWIYSNRLRPVSAAVQPLDFSDHHAIRAEFANVP